MQRRAVTDEEALPARDLRDPDRGYAPRPVFVTLSYARWGLLNVNDLLIYSVASSAVCSLNMVPHPSPGRPSLAGFASCLLMLVTEP